MREGILISVAGMKNQHFLWRLHIGRPSKFFQELWASFFHFCSLSWLLSCLTFWGLLWIDFHSDAVLVQSGLRLFNLRRKGQLHHRKAHMYKRICVLDCSWLLILVLILDHVRPVWSGCEMKCFCCITGTIVIYFVHGHEFELSWHWDELTAIFHWLQFHYLRWLK